MFTPTKKRKSGSGPRPDRAFEAPKKIKLGEVKTQLEDAFTKAYAKGHPSEFAQVNVILLHFDNDDLNVGPLEEALAKTFKDEYGYIVRQVVLPGKKVVGSLEPEYMVHDVIRELRKSGALEEGCLVIIGFSGHGRAQNGELEVGGKMFNGAFMGHSMEWKATWHLLFKAQCDVLQILDCCNAAEGSHEAVEMLAATSATEIASSSADTCFTQALNKQLQYMGSEAFSVSELAGAMMADRRILDLDYFPIYGPCRDKRSVILKKKDIGSVKGKSVIKANTKTPTVVITAHTEESLSRKDITEFRRWVLTNLPRTVNKIEVNLDGWHDADSAILSINMPVEVWLQLPDEDAYNFVAHVRSRNNLMQPLVATPTVMQSPLSILATRPPTGPENKQPGPSKSEK